MGRRNTGKESKPDLLENRALAADMMAGGASDASIAEVMGVHHTTVTRWRHRDDVSAEVARIQRNAAHSARAKIAHAMHGAIDTLTRLSESAESEEIQMKAAIALIDKGLPAMEAAPAPSFHVALSQNVTVEEAKAFVQSSRGVIDGK